MRHLLLFGLLLLVPVLPAEADSLFRCVARSGAVSYQSQPCSAQQRLDRVVDYRPEPMAAHMGRASILTHRQPRTGMRMAAARGIRGGTLTASDRCRAGKTQREASLQRLGLKRTYDQLSALDASVRAVCGGY